MISPRDTMRNELVAAYRAAGEDFLADRLQRIFTEIKDDRDRILHNEVLTEVSILIDNQPKGFLKSIASLILYELPKPRKTFLRLVANRIMLLTQKKGQDNG